METVQSVVEAFVNAPVFFIVPLVLLGFVLWSPWAPATFYIHHDYEHLDTALDSGMPETAWPS